MASRFEKKLIEEMTGMEKAALTDLQTENHQAAKGRYDGLKFALNLYRTSNRAENDEDGEPL